MLLQYTCDTWKYTAASLHWRANSLWVHPLPRLAFLASSGTARNSCSVPSRTASSEALVVPRRRRHMLSSASNTHSRSPTGDRQQDSTNKSCQIAGSTNHFKLYTLAASVCDLRILESICICFLKSRPSLSACLSAFTSTKYFMLGNNSAVL